MTTAAESGASAWPPGNSEAMFDLGLRYANGLDVDCDLVQAHKWLNIAAARGYDAARAVRAEIAEYMTRDEVEEAQRQAREWLRLNAH